MSKEGVNKLLEVAATNPTVRDALLGGNIDWALAKSRVVSPNANIELNENEKSVMEQTFADKLPKLAKMYIDAGLTE